MNQEQIAAQFVAHMQERFANTFMELLGMRFVEVSQERAIGEMHFTPKLQQLTGVFHAGALIALADSTATFACMYWSHRRERSLMHRCLRDSRAL